MAQGTVILAFSPDFCKERSMTTNVELKAKLACLYAGAVWGLSGFRSGHLKTLAYTVFGSQLFTFSFQRWPLSP